MVDDAVNYKDNNTKNFIYSWGSFRPHRTNICLYIPIMADNKFATKISIAVEVAADLYTYSGGKLGLHRASTQL